VTTVNDLSLTEFHWSDGGNHGLSGTSSCAGDNRRYVRIVGYRSTESPRALGTRLRTAVTRSQVRVEVWIPPTGWVEVITGDDDGSGWEDVEAVEVMADYEYRALRILGDVDL